MRRAWLPALIRRYLSRLKFPRLFVLTAAIFTADLFFPDVVPFIDEIMLGLGTALLASWRRGRGERRLASGDDPDRSDGVEEPVDGAASRAGR